MHLLSVLIFVGLKTEIKKKKKKKIEASLKNAGNIFSRSPRIATQIVVFLSRFCSFTLDSPPWCSLGSS